MKARQRWWGAYALAVAASLGGMAWVSASLIRLDHAQARALADSNQQAELRLALWQMDSILTPILAREAARDAGDYACPSEEVGRAGSLASFESDLIPLHFQWEPGVSQIADPGVGVAVRGCVSPQLGQSPSETETQPANEQDQRRLQILARLQSADPSTLEGLLDASTKRQDRWVQPDPDPTLAALSVGPADDLFRNQLELSQRVHFQRSYNVTPSWINVDEDPRVLSAFQGMWLPHGDEHPLLLCLRKVQLDAPTLQGFSFEWKLLRELLLEQADEVDVVVRPLRSDDPAAALGNVLSALPIAIDLNESAHASVLSSSTRATLYIAWTGALVTLLACGYSLRASLAYGDKRSRFASTVTHELRTPLTTFRMYSEMLSKGMVAEDKRAEYLSTLEREAERLSHLVENVLAYARIEEGRGEAAIGVVESLTASALLGRIVPLLEAHAKKEGMLLEVLEPLNDDVDAKLATDVRAVEQILFNLLDNACKYGRREGTNDIRLRLTCPDSTVVLEVIDRGEGVPRGQARSIFEAFERGSRDETDPRPGVGLGLVLARELAHALGGTLVLVPRTPDEPGACFRLTLPRLLAE